MGHTATGCLIANGDAQALWQLVAGHPSHDKPLMLQEQIAGFGLFCAGEPGQNEIGHRRVGEYPEFYGLTVKWSPIIISVPEPYMRRVDIYFDLPSVTMKRQEFILGLPKVTMERVRWVVGLPQFTVVNVSVKTDEIKRSGQALQEEATSVGAQLKQEIEAEVAKFTGSISAAAYGTKTEITNQYNSALGGVRSAIDGLLAQGCDPIKVPTDNGDVNLRKLYDEIDAGKARALLEVDHSAGIVG